MFLRSLSLTNFKNYTESSLGFSGNINCFVGKNGVGKTNILDAIHYLSLTKSFFHNTDVLNIKHGEDFFMITGEFMDTNDDEGQSVFCACQKSKQKVFKRNGKEYQRISEHIGRFPVVMISPEDSVLITGSSEERRKFLNAIISQYDRNYLEALLRYNRTLMQRNRFLKELNGRMPDPDLIDVLNEQLVATGNIIYNSRLHLINELIPVFQEYYSHISMNRESVKLKYISQLNENDFSIILKEGLRKDLALQYTSVGIHRDDLLFELEEVPVKITGSQGQQKSYLVALKLAKFGYIQEKSGITPILLLDDIFDKFDSDRVEQIVKLVGNHKFGQIFITDTQQEHLQSILARTNAEYKLFSIDNDGAVVTINENGEEDEKK